MNRGRFNYRLRENGIMANEGPSVSMREEGMIDNVKRHRTLITCDKGEQAAG